VTEIPNPGLSGWDNFFVIVGSSGAALIGLQFVVITLITDSRHRTTPASLGAFGTPTVVHLAGALLISAIMSAPWWSLFPLSIALAVTGLLGLGYCAMVVKHARRTLAFVIGGSALALLLIAIHNAWDTVTYIVVADPEAVETCGSKE
jgi:hypothetical protein